MWENLLRPEVLGPLIGFGLVVIVPIVAMLLRHQRKMAEMMQKGQSPEAGVQQRLDHMQSQMDEIKALMTDHVLRQEERLTALSQTAALGVPHGQGPGPEPGV
ncbi:MAG: hypothetical protein IH851_00170 [Armatimonadetes bacterium]|nr:hypothetical protein [Armatimonadota bacterium]